MRKAHQSTFAQCKTNSVSGVLKSVDNQLSEHTIRGCQRLGKYSNDKCRPILVKLTRSCDITSILSKYAKFANMPGISIKPDLSKDDRKVESILLMERRKLIQSGTTSQ